MEKKKVTKEQRKLAALITLLDSSKESSLHNVLWNATGTDRILWDIFNNIESGVKTEYTVPEARKMNSFIDKYKDELQYEFCHNLAEYNINEFMYLDGNG